jgi:hypothetical protein
MILSLLHVGITQIYPYYQASIRPFRLPESFPHSLSIFKSLHGRHMAAARKACGTIFHRT